MMRVGKNIRLLISVNEMGDDYVSGIIGTISYDRIREESVSGMQRISLEKEFSYHVLVTLNKQKQETEIIVKR